MPFASSLARDASLRHYRGKRDFARSPEPSPLRCAHPTKRNRRVQLPMDGFTYALRNRIERTMGRLKNARRVATRYDKTATSYLGFVQLTAIRLWIKHFINTA